MEGISYFTYWFYFETKKKNSDRTNFNSSTNFVLISNTLCSQPICATLNKTEAPYSLVFKREYASKYQSRITLISSLQNVKVKNSKTYCEFIVNVWARLKNIIWLFWLHFGWLPWKYPFHLPSENQKRNKKAPPSPLGFKSMVCQVKWNFIILQLSHLMLFFLSYSINWWKKRISCIEFLFWSL